MDKLRFIVVWMAVGFVVAVIAFILGMQYFPDYITLTISVLSLLVLIFIVVMVFFATNKRMPKVFDPKIEHLVHTINQTFYSSPFDKKKEEGVKSLVSSAYDIVNKIFTSTFVMGIVFSITMILVGVLAYAVVIKQNKIIQTQNYLICKQNEFLEGTNRFNSSFEPKSKKLDNLLYVQEAVTGFFRGFSGCDKLSKVKNVCHWASITGADGPFYELTTRQKNSYPSNELNEIASTMTKINFPNKKQTDSTNKKLTRNAYNLLVKADKIIKKEVNRLGENSSVIQSKPINCDDYKPSSN